MFVAVGYNGSDVTSIYYSTNNGSTWEPATGDVFSTGVEFAYSVATDKKGNWIVTGNASDDKNIVYSDDGMSWSVVSGDIFAAGANSIVKTNNTL